METKRPTNIEVADHFYHDSVDLLLRFRCCHGSDVPDFTSLKSRRIKCFIDLRMAMESALKSVVAYFYHGNLEGEKLVKRVENYRHHIEKLRPKAVPYLPEGDISEKATDLCDEFSRLPVGLRYRLDVMDFIRNREEIYYSTIGCDEWLDSAATIIEKISEFIGGELSKESRCANASEMWEEFQQPRFEKYKKDGG